MSQILKAITRAKSVSKNDKNVAGFEDPVAKSIPVDQPKKSETRGRSFDRIQLNAVLSIVLVVLIVAAVFLNYRLSSNIVNSNQKMMGVISGLKEQRNGLLELTRNVRKLEESLGSNQKQMDGRLNQMDQAFSIRANELKKELLIQQNEWVNLVRDQNIKVNQLSEQQQGVVSLVKNFKDSLDKVNSEIDDIKRNTDLLNSK